MKKIASLVLALVMALALAVPAFAANSGTNTGTNGKITIDNAIPEQTYSIYQIFELVSYSDVETQNPESPTVGTIITDGNLSYKATTEWKEFITSAKNAAGENLFELDKNDLLVSTKLETEADVAKFAKDALAWAKSKNLTPVDSKKAPAATAPATTVTVEFDKIPLGYYLVDSTAGALCSLNTTAPAATIKEKNDVPTVDKEVKEDDKTTGEWGDTNDADIGQKVEYRTTINVTAGAQNYVLHDTMDAGLTFNDDVTVTLKHGETETTISADGHYTVTQNVPHTEGEGENAKTETCTFDVTFVQSWLDELVAGDQIIVSYSATVNEDAVVAGEGNDNETYLEYGNKNHTEKDKTKTYTWKVNVNKINAENERLANAKFTLSKQETGTPVIEFVAVADKANTYRVATADDKKDGSGVTVITEITTNEAGEFSLEGLDSGTYYLTETEAPAGYNKLSAPIKITIDGTETTNPGNVTSIVKDKDGKEVSTDVGTGAVQVVNNSGPELPSTGGIGTTIFYVVGGLLAAGAVILLITKRRMNVGE